MLVRFCFGAIAWASSLGFRGEVFDFLRPHKSLAYCLLSAASYTLVGMGFFFYTYDLTDYLTDYYLLLLIQSGEGLFLLHILSYYMSY